MTRRWVAGEPPAGESPPRASSPRLDGPRTVPVKHRTTAAQAVLQRRLAFAVLLAAVLVAMPLFVTFDLDRPTRGLVTIPDTAFTSLRASMALPPAAE